MKRIFVIVMFGLMILESFGQAATPTEQRFYRALGGAGLWFWSEGSKGQLASNECRWCESNSFDNYVRNQWKWEDTEKADQLSNVLAYGVIPLTGLAALQWLNENDTGDKKFEKVTYVAEAAIYSSLLNQMTKFLVARERPFVHAMNASEKSKTKSPSDNNLSFYSGHTNLSFALAVGFAQSFQDTPVLQQTGWGLLSLAAMVGYLRIAADKHYATDVLVGALTGTLFALSMKPKTDSQTQVLASPNLIVVSYFF